MCCACTFLSPLQLIAHRLINAPRHSWTNRHQSVCGTNVQQLSLRAGTFGLSLPPLDLRVHEFLRRDEKKKRSWCGGLATWNRHGVGMGKLQKPDIDMRREVTPKPPCFTTIVPNSERWLRPSHLRTGLGVLSSDLRMRERWGDTVDRHPNARKDALP